MAQAGHLVELGLWREECGPGRLHHRAERGSWVTAARGVGRASQKGEEAPAQQIWHLAGANRPSLPLDHVLSLEPPSISPLEMQVYGNARVQAHSTHTNCGFCL